MWNAVDDKDGSLVDTRKPSVLSEEMIDGATIVVGARVGQYVGILVCIEGIEVWALTYSIHWHCS